MDQLRARVCQERSASLRAQEQLEVLQGELANQVRSLLPSGVCFWSRQGHPWVRIQQPLQLSKCSGRGRGCQESPVGPGVRLRGPSGPQLPGLYNVIPTLPCLLHKAPSGTLRGCESAG